MDPVQNKPINSPRTSSDLLNLKLRLDYFLPSLFSSLPSASQRRIGVHTHTHTHTHTRTHTHTHRHTHTKHTQTHTHRHTYTQTHTHLWHWHKGEVQHKLEEKEDEGGTRRRSAEHTSAL